MPAIVVMRLRLGVEGVRHGSGQPRRTANECVVRRVARGSNALAQMTKEFGCEKRSTPLQARTRTHAQKAYRSELRRIRLGLRRLERSHSMPAGELLQRGEAARGAGCTTARIDWLHFKLQTIGIDQNDALAGISVMRARLHGA